MVDLVEVVAVVAGEEQRKDRRGDLKTHRPPIGQTRRARTLANLQVRRPLMPELPQVQIAGAGVGAAVDAEGREIPGEAAVSQDEAVLNLDNNEQLTVVDALLGAI